MSTPTKKIDGLDSLRFFAFFSIFLFHTVPAFSQGFLGVDFFFVVSIFLLTLLALRELNKTGKFSRRNFFIRRSLRIWPLYFLVVLGIFFGIPILSSQLGLSATLPENWWYYFLFVSNYEYSDHLFALKFLWSIAIEEQFYFFFLFLSLLFRKHFGWSVALLTLGYLLFSFGVNIYNWPAYGNSPNYLFNFAAGMLLASLHHKGQELSWQQSLLIAAACVICLVSLNMSEIQGFEKIPICGIFVLIISATIQAFRRFNLKALLPFSITEKLGKYTYGLYVYSGIVFTLNYKVLHIEDPILRFFVLLALTIGLSVLSFELFEKHFLRLKDQFR